jgi:TonB family protein
MDFLRQSWVGCAIASLLIHGTILSVAFPWKGQDKRETIEVTLLAEDLSYQPSVSNNGYRVRHSVKVRQQGKDRNALDSSRTEQRTAADGTAQGPSQSPPPSAERLTHSAASDPSDSHSIPGPPDKVELGGCSAGATLQGSGKDPASGGSGTRTTMAGSNGGVKAGTGDGGTGHGAVEFGGPEGPRFMHREIPEYPLYCRRRKKEGKVLLMIHITEKGKLSSVEVLEASDRIFIGPSVDAIKRSTFAPATQKGAPVPASALLPIRFTLDEGVPTVQQRSY